jgi:hypothetical protein
MLATYVSVWDGGEEIRTLCDYDTETQTASNIEQCDDVEDLDILEEEFIELPSGVIIKSFYNADEDVKIVEGQKEN